MQPRRAGHLARALRSAATVLAWQCGSHPSAHSSAHPVAGACAPACSSVAHGQGVPPAVLRACLRVGATARVCRRHAVHATLTDREWHVLPGLQREDSGAMASASLTASLAAVLAKEHTESLDKQMSKVPVFGVPLMEGTLSTLLGSVPTLVCSLGILLGLFGDAARPYEAHSENMLWTSAVFACFGIICTLNSTRVRVVLLIRCFVDRRFVNRTLKFVKPASAYCPA